MFSYHIKIDYAIQNQLNSLQLNDSINMLNTLIFIADLSQIRNMGYSWIQIYTYCILITDV